MKFICDKTALQREISLVQEIIASRSSISVLSNVFLQAENGSLTIKATDLKVNFETILPVDIQENGTTTVFSDKFFNILASIPEGDISFEQENNKIVIKPLFKKIKFQLKTISADNFPILPAIEETKYFLFPAKTLKQMIVTTIFAISDDETRYFMNGVYLEKKGGNLNFVATDGRRLAYISKVSDSEIADFVPVIIPPKILNIILKHAGDENPISLAINEKYLYVKFGNYYFSSLLIEGQFPNYQRVIPEQQQFKVILKRSELLESLKRIAILVEQKSRKTIMAFSQDTLSISTDESEYGTAKEDISCEYQGPEMVIALNYRYLEDPLKVIATETVAIEFSETTRVISLYPEPKSDFFHIITSMQPD